MYVYQNFSEFIVPLIATLIFLEVSFSPVFQLSVSQEETVSELLRT